MTVPRAVTLLGLTALIALSTVYVAGCGRTTGLRSYPPSIPLRDTATAATPATPNGPPAPTTQPSEHEQLCSRLTWPRPMPAVIGLIFQQGPEILNPLLCLDSMRGFGVDGSIVYQQEAFMPDAVHSYRIVTVSRPPGAPVGQHDPVTVNLVPVESREPEVYHPCDWVSTTEASEFLGGAAVTAETGGNEIGSTDLQCGYRSPDHATHMVLSELRLTKAHVVDAASEFAFKTEREDSTSVRGLGVKAACTPAPKFHALYVLLPAERIYIATGWAGESCDTLKQFAESAIPRISL